MANHHKFFRGFASSMLVTDSNVRDRSIRNLFGKHVPVLECGEGNRANTSQICLRPTLIHFDIPYDSQ